MSYGEFNIIYDRDLNFFLEKNLYLDIISQVPTPGYFMDQTKRFNKSFAIQIFDAILKGNQGTGYELLVFLNLLRDNQR